MLGVQVNILSTIMLKKYQNTGTSHNLNTPFKKVTQHDFDRLYLCTHRFIFVTLNITGKHVYLLFD